MKNLFIKIKIIFFPFLLVALGTILLYSGFRWLFDIHLGILPLTKEIWEFWIPTFSPFVPLWIFLRKRIQILQQAYDSNRHFMYLLLLTIPIGFPNAVLQDYLSTAMYDLREVASVLQIKDFKKEKFFDIQDYSIDREKVAVHTIQHKNGRHKSNLDFKFYAAAPFGTLESKVWHGIKYTERHQNKSKDLNQAAYKLFLNQSNSKYNRFRPSKAVYFEKLVPSNDRNAYIAAIAHKYPNIAMEEQIILIPKTTPFGHYGKGQLLWVAKSLGIGALFALVLLIFPKIDKKAYKKLKNTNRKYKRK